MPDAPPAVVWTVECLKFALGFVLVYKATDAINFAQGEFVMLAGVASTVVGSVVVYDSATYKTTLAPVGSNLPRAVAIAMAG